MPVNKVVFLRHGESVWNVENIFTGWADVELSPTGEMEAVEAGKCLKEKGFKFDVVFTSVLERAIRTAWTACAHSKNLSMPIINSWRLNERHYGGLQGLNKAETAAKHGDDQVKIWRRSYDVPPPSIEASDPRHPCNDPLYAGVPRNALPGAESLKLTVERVLPFWNDHIAPCVLAGRQVLVAAHGNSLRALCKHLENMSEKEVLDLNIPTAVPLVYELDENLTFIKKYYLMDEAEVAKKMAAVAAQGKATRDPSKSIVAASDRAWAQVAYVVSKIYGGTAKNQAVEMMKSAVEEHLKICRTEGLPTGGDDAITTNDTTLITYANTFIDSTNAKMPLKCLTDFVKKYKTTDAMKCIHMLPMFPWDTDRGFSVMDYYKVDPRYGDWSDVEALGAKDCGSPAIMFDYVCNHASVDNPWVQNGLIQRHIPKGHPQYEEMQKFADFVTAFAEDDGPAEEQRPPEEVLAKLTRPRANPVLSQYFVMDNGSTCSAHLGTPDVDGPGGNGKVIGTGYVWTTFSRAKRKDGKEDTRQVDLNYRNPIVLAEVVRVLLFYVRKGSTVIRLDAIGYIWKVLGSSSIHERGCHMLLAALYQVLKIADRRVITIAEVNEPVVKCRSYLGTDELPESNMAYNFAPFSLALHAQITNNVNFYLEWLKTLADWKGKAFITLLGSHDGLAQKQARDILPPEELEKLHNALLGERGGLANYAFAPGGHKIVYEACGTPWCLVNGIYGTEKEPFSTQLARYVNIICLGLIPKGMPGIYAQGYIGALNYNPPEGLDENRTLNRESFDINTLFAKLDDATSHEGQVFRTVHNIMKLKMKYPQFDRTAPEPEPLVELDPAVLAVLLAAPDPSISPMLVVINASNEKRTAKVQGVPDELINCHLHDALGGLGGGMEHQDVESKQPGGQPGLKRSNTSVPSFDADLVIEMSPYECLWLVKELAN
eukprot:gnl/TRDRNA2_/TRDRNA2_153737_c0_seq5.p1 gnl/TRDRNA2_/TRDRNA2_153737_c0~~gnl/TRDRNA2_/TRDRNA2_153737_c0_seq5.p1  ORF type:complete len:940 (-),score=215.18 gnl/TRDRNA2_/TRDRNA2_153737_c0_seq5:658-3477(-)